MASSSAGNKPQQPWSKESTPSYVVNDRPTAIQLEDAPHNSTPTTSPPPTKPTTKSSFHHLFTFTTRGHVPLLLLSLGTAAAVAAARTAYAVLLGHIFQVVSRFGAGLLSPDDFLAQIARWAVWLCVLGAGMWLFATVDAAAWVVLGELRARCVREQVFGVWLRRRAVAWFEAREEGVGALVAGVQS
jgi:ATP-binding cassette subfamily B (MDR/TAP) protein 1